MPQIGGKPVKKSSKTKSSSTSKRHFTIVIGTKEHGLYVSSSPSSAARKAVSKLCGKNVKNVEFCLREITQGSKKKTYGPYLGHIEKLAKPIQLKGRLVERMPVARLKPKSSANKGGMRGEEEENEGTEMRNMSPIPSINMNNVYSNREKEFMSDYYQLQSYPAGQSPTAVSNKYCNIPRNRQEFLENIVKQKF